MNITDLTNTDLAQRLQHKLDQKTKPLGSLGRIEALALQLGLILGTEEPQLLQPQLVVFAADHGLAAATRAPGRGGVGPRPAGVDRDRPRPAAVAASRLSNTGGHDD